MKMGWWEDCLDVCLSWWWALECDSIWNLGSPECKREIVGWGGAEHKVLPGSDGRTVALRGGWTSDVSPPFSPPLLHCPISLLLIFLSTTTTDIISSPLSPPYQGPPIATRIRREWERGEGSKEKFPNATKVFLEPGYAFSLQLSFIFWLKGIAAAAAGVVVWVEGKVCGSSLRTYPGRCYLALRVGENEKKRKMRSFCPGEEWIAVSMLNLNSALTLTLLSTLFLSFPANFLPPQSPSY